VLFARHGESEANLRHEIANRDSTYGLTASGRRQAASLAESLRPGSVSRILSSPSRRAVETSEILARSLAVPIELAEALREFDCGVYEGRSHEAAWTAHADVQRRWLEHGRAEARMDGGESLVDLRARFLPFVRRLLAHGGRHETLVLVGHGGLYRCVLPDVVDGIDPSDLGDLALGYARYVTADLRPDGRLVYVDRPHRGPAPAGVPEPLGADAGLMS
jgi:broad specificity phosphatase PhoE